MPTVLDVLSWMGLVLTLVLAVREWRLVNRRVRANEPADRVLAIWLSASFLLITIGKVLDLLG